MRRPSLFRTASQRAGRRPALSLVAALLLPSIAGAQGTVTGKATAAGQPIVDVRVLVRGTSLTATTNEQGVYTLRNVPTGSQIIEALRVGYRAQQATVQMSGSETKTVDFAMETAVVQLADVVTTATGEQRRVELGNAIQTFGDVNAKVETTPVNDLADLMVAKAPGVVVLPGNETGSSPVVRIRGTNSLSLSNAPIYVIDGVRMTSASVGVGTGGTTTSFLNDVTPEDIEDIEIVKGPSAATLYGTDAANGVIVITTKKGRAGSTRWTYYGEAGTVDDRNDYATQYALFGHNSSGALTRCVLETVSLGQCTPDSLLSFNPLLNSSITPIHLGHRDEYGAQASGGSEAVRFYFGGDLENEIGPIKMPAFAQNWLDSVADPATNSEVYPEAFQKQSIRTNVSGTLSPTLDLNASASFSNRNQRLPQTDNNSTSIFGTALKNPGFQPNHSVCSVTPANCLGYTDVGSLGENLMGYGNFMPAQTFQDQLTEGVQRFIGDLDANWRPFAWMQNEANVGVDLSDRDDWQLCMLNECSNSGTERQGFVDDQRGDNRNFTAKLVSNSSWQARPWANMKTTFGADYINSITDDVASNGSGLPPGAQNVGQAAVLGGSNQLETANKTLGLYVQEQAGIRDRLFLTAAVRTDQNSAFGTEFQRVFYPKLSGSWIISDEGFFPRMNWLDQLRLRSAYGASGVQPGATTSLQTFSAVTRAINTTTPGNAAGADTPGLIASALGNPDLRPEKSAEFESGFESRMFNSAVDLDFTFYDKKTHDALIAQPIAGSAAPSNLSVTRNLGSVENSGIEATLTARVLDRRQLGWDITLAGSHNNNKILSLGFDATGKPNPTIGTGTTRDSVGLPANAWFFIPYTFSDANHDGIIAPSEVQVGTGAVYMGYSSPRDIFSVSNDFDFLDRKLRFNILLDYKGGFSVFNNTVEFYCAQQPTCYEETNANAPLWRQARNIAQRYEPVTTQAGYLENGQFWRLREVSATLAMPNAMAQRLRARDASLVFSGRNLHLWSKYTDVDPEQNYTTGDVQTDFETIAPPTYFIVRLNLHY